MYDSANAQSVRTARTESDSYQTDLRYFGFAPASQLRFEDLEGDDE